MNKRFVVVVIDSFGVGSMDDCEYVRQIDVGTNTAYNLINNLSLKLPILEKLGIMNAIGRETSLMKKSKCASYAVSNLAHFGADTYFGHQEIMGTKPEKPISQRFSDNIEKVIQKLIDSGFRVHKHEINGVSALIVNDAMLIGDNMETDLGQAINVSGAFDLCSYEEVLKVGNIVRDLFAVPRIIALGGENVSIERIKSACFEKDGFIGIDTPKSGLYEQGYLVSHIGFGVDTSKQLPKVLKSGGISTNLYGKVADIVANDDGKSYFGVDTSTLFCELIADLKREKEGFFCLNVQETDLAGHRCDAQEYAKVLQITDVYLNEIIELLDSDDMLIVMADHGNDPYTGRSQHSREKVPILMCGNIQNGFYGERKTMSDVGQTVAKFFNLNIDNGTSIL